MKDIIGPKYKYLLYQNECRDDFMLTGGCEIYLQILDKPKLICFGNSSSIRQYFKWLILDSINTDEGNYIRIRLTNINQKKSYQKSLLIL